MNATTTLSQKYQVVIPKAIRQQMGLKAGAKIYIQPINHNQAVITKEPISYSEALEGLGQNVWKKLGGTRYIKQLRKE